MSKRLIFILVIITTLMMVGAALTSSGKKNSSLQSQSSSSSLDSLLGKRPPDFSLQNQNGETFTLASFRGRKTVLFFNEGIMCYPACWNQIATLGTDSKLNNAAIASASIVTDSPKEWNRAFAQMPDLNKGNILFDTSKDVSFKYNMMNLPSSMHKGSMPGHTYLVLDQNGIVRYVYDDPTMSVQDEKLIDELNKI